jgi:hypothetical protein
MPKNFSDPMTAEAKEAPGIRFVGRIPLETPEDYVGHAIDCVALVEGTRHE